MPCMRAGFLIGCLVGALMLGAGLVAGSNWYDYRLAATSPEIREMVNAQGWEVVPGQNNPAYLRRPRLHFP